MNRGYAWAEQHALDVGDRVRIREGRWPLPGIVDQVGTVVEALRVPSDTYLVRVDGDTHPSRVWFFYRVDVVPAMQRPAVQTMAFYHEKD